MVPCQSGNRNTGLRHLIREDAAAIQHTQALALTEADLHEAIRTWCRGTRYWTCLVEGASRVDLAGQEAGHLGHMQSRTS